MPGQALSGWSDFVAAETASIPSLTISQLKITSNNGQFVRLYNRSDQALDMTHYRLEYFNHYDLSKSTSSRSIALSGTVPPHGYYMISDSVEPLCYQQVVNSVSLGFSSTAGMVQVAGQSQASIGGAVQPVLHDSVSWSKTAVPGVQTLPAANNGSLLRTGSLDWVGVRPDDDPCQLLSIGNSTTVAMPASSLPGEPPASIMLGEPSTQTEASVANNGLKAPTITELLPNPAGTGNDTTEEYIEMHNSNTAPFDLSGYVLQTGATTMRSFTFPEGSILAPQSFKAWYAATTKLSLSNTASHARLLDPSGAVIAQSDPYSSAKDGHAWALGQGKWQWTMVLTPDKTNVIQAPVAAKKSNTKNVVKNNKAALPIKNGAGTATSSSNSAFAEEPAATPVHVRTLALVGAAALLYGAYEYRQDMANRVYQFRGYCKARLRTWYTFTRRRNHRAVE